MNYKIHIPRQSYDGLVSFLQRWGEIYSLPGAVVLRGTIRSELTTQCRGSAVVHATADCSDAQVVALHYNYARCALGRSKVMADEALLDLRDLSDEEIEAMEFVGKVAILLPQQTSVLRRISEAIVEFRQIPAMLRLAISAQD